MEGPIHNVENPAESPAVTVTIHTLGQPKALISRRNGGATHIAFILPFGE